MLDLIISSLLAAVLPHALDSHHCASPFESGPTRYGDTALSDVCEEKERTVIHGLASRSDYRVIARKFTCVY